MSIERIFHCDWRDCEGHVRTMAEHPPFLVVTQRDEGPLHFCHWDCLLKHAAEKPPVETIPWGES